MGSPAPDWLLHSTSIALMSLAALLALWALLWDRSRGRKRCPKCWYAMEGIPALVCPECGHAASNARKLMRTRRRWGFAAISAAAIGAAHVLGCWPRIRESGWTGAVPTTALILALPHTTAGTVISPAMAQRLGSPYVPPPPAVVLYDALQWRAKAGHLWGWQERLLVRRCLRGDSSAPIGTLAWRDKFGDLLDALPEGRLTPSENRARRRANLVSVIGCRPRWPEGIPLRVVLSDHDEHAGDTDRQLVALPDLPGASEATCGVRSRSVLCVLGSSAWRDATQPVGIPPTGPQRITFSLRLLENDKPCWAEDITIPVLVGGSVDDVIRPVRSSVIDEELRTQIKLGLDQRTFRLRLPPSSLAHRVTLGLAIEFIRDGQILARGKLRQNAAAPFVFPEIVPYLPGDLGDPVLPTTQDAQGWSVRIRGDGDLALGDLESTRYWSGEITIPLPELLARSAAAQTP